MRAFRGARTGGLRAVLAAALAVLLAACTAEEPPAPAPGPLRLGTVMIGSLEESHAAYDPLVRALEAGLGAPVELQLFDNGAAFAERFRAGGLDVTLMSTAGLRELADDPGVVPLVKPAAEQNGASVFVARSGEPGASIADFRGRRLAFGARESLSGHQMPRRFLVEQGIEPEAFFASVAYAGGHREVLESLLRGECDLAVLEALPQLGFAADAVRVVWLSPSYTNYLIAAHPRLAPETRQVVRDALLALAVQPGAEPGPRSPFSARFVPATLADLALPGEKAADARR